MFDREPQFTISLKDLRFFSTIGLFEQERLIGNEFIVNIDVSFYRSTPVDDNSLDEMISYVDIYNIVNEEMKTGGKLLETVAWRISKRIKNEKPIISYGKITIAKMRPPISGIDGFASVSLEF